MISPNFQTREKVVQDSVKRGLVCDFVSKNFTTDNGKPFLFKDREYFWPIYENNWPMIVIMSSRQAEKSSFVGKRSFYELMTTPNEAILYATASSYNLSIFAHSKIDRLFEHRPALKLECFD